MLEFYNVIKSFQEDFWKPQKVILDELNFKLDEGALCGFLGANGAGKTTSIKAILGFISIDSGRISFDPSMGKTFNEIKSHIGYFPEHPYFYPFMTGREFCHYLGKLQQVDRKTINENMTSWSKELNIEFALDQKIKTYSKGMLQRLGFVTALIHSPRFVILDEPLSGLDPVGRKEFKDVLVGLNKKGVTIFFSSHIVSDVEEICDSLVVIKDGKTFFNGPKKQLLGQSLTNDFKIGFHLSGSLSDISSFKSVKVLKKDQEEIFLNVSDSEKDGLIDYMLKQGATLTLLEMEKSTLEEIVYATKGSNV